MIYLYRLVGFSLSLLAPAIGAGGCGLSGGEPARAGALTPGPRHCHGSLRRPSPSRTQSSPPRRASRAALPAAMPSRERWPLPPRPVSSVCPVPYLPPLSLSVVRVGAAPQPGCVLLSLPRPDISLWSDSSVGLCSASGRAWRAGWCAGDRLVPPELPYSIQLSSLFAARKSLVPVCARVAVR